MAVSDLKDAKLLEALLGGSTIEDAATAAGMSARTARRHMARESFREQLTESRQAVVRAVVCRLTSGAESVTSVLLALIEDSQTPPSVRRAAGRDWLESLQSFGSAEDLAARLGELEKAIEKLSERRAP